MIGETEKGATQVLNIPTKQEDQLEAAPSFFLITQGIKFHQHAESKLIPNSIKTVDPNNTTPSAPLVR